MSFISLTKAKPKTKAKPGNLREIGSSGLERFSGEVQDDFMKSLQGQAGIAVFKEMSSNDGIVGAILFSIDMLIKGVEWKVVPKTSSAEDKKASEFVDSCIHSMNHTWNDLMSEALSMLVYGWSYHEIVYKKRDDGLIGWKKIVGRAQDTLYKWEFDETGSIKGLYQQAPPNYEIVFIPIEKALLFRTQIKKNNPEGRSILRTAYRAWYHKKNIEMIEAIGIERDLAGLPIAWVPVQIMSSEATANEKATLSEIKKIVTNIRRDEQEGLVMPLAYDENGNKLYDFGLLSSGSKRSFNTNAIVNRYRQEIAMSVMADFILLGHERVGSFALASSKTKLFSTAIGSWLSSISDVFNKHAITRLLVLNGLSGEVSLEHGDIETVDLQILGDYIGRLSSAGIDVEKVEDYLFEQANIPLGKERDSDSPKKKPEVKPEKESEKENENR